MSGASVGRDNCCLGSSDGRLISLVRSSQHWASESERANRRDRVEGEEEHNIHSFSPFNTLASSRSWALAAGPWRARRICGQDLLLSTPLNDTPFLTFRLPAFLCGGGGGGRGSTRGFTTLNRISSYTKYDV